MFGRFPAVLVLILSCFVEESQAFSSTPTKPSGSAAKPYEKKNVAVFGAGGYLGGMVFGFLQRAGSIYGTGIANLKSPRAICATGFASANLNGILSKHFVLAQADESFVKLTDMTSVESIQKRLAGFDAVILGTCYTLDKRPVTGGSYEKSPNDKAFEFYLDTPRSKSIVGVEDNDFSAALFESSLEACKKAGIQHAVVIETELSLGKKPATDSYIQQLDACGIPYTYIQPLAKMENIQEYTYNLGIQGDLSIRQGKSDGSSGPIPREDVSALAVQALLSLNWSESRVLNVSCPGPVKPISAKPKFFDKEWCVNSDTLAQKLSSL
jgi:hypothetical protein